MKRRSRFRIETPRQLRRAIVKLSPASPKTDRFSAQWRRLGRRGGRQQEQKSVWYKTQHEHWLGWLREYDGPGAYDRAIWKRTAEFVYNHIVNPQMLIYLAEASKVEPELIAKATRRALLGKGTMGSMSAAIRGVLPWALVEAALTGSSRGNPVQPSRARTQQAGVVIRTKSVHEPIEPRKDGFRILATRIRGRGLSSTSSRYDVWMANLGPSEMLLRAMQAGRITWAEFRRRYREELFEGGTIDRRNRTIKNHGQKFTLRLLQALAKQGPITVMCHCAEDEPYCHRHLLQKVLLGKV